MKPSDVSHEEEGQDRNGASAGAEAIDDSTRTSDAAAQVAPAPPPATRGAAPLQQRDRDRYDVIGVHGRGGLGTVSRAHDRELGRHVAIKELIVHDDRGEVRFLREALITARLEHPGIVPIHEAGRWPDGTPFYVMKLVSGRSLKELIIERHSVEERLGLLHHVIAVADAVAYAHKRGIIHRDLKPANVIAGDFGETIVIDWGLAKDLSVSEEPAIEQTPYRELALDDLTATGSVLGTPMYMAPEQSRGEPVDQRADVFAIGAMLWELCSLHRVPPLDAHQRDRMLRQSGVDPDLAAIVAKAIASDPKRRYRDAGELAADLKAFRSGVRIGARRYSPLAVLVHWARHHRALTATILAALVLFLAGSVVFVRNIARERDRADASAVVAEAARKVASDERDKARLSEASALLEKDPTSARKVLESIVTQSPQRALLMSRVNQRAAQRVVPLPAFAYQLHRHPRTGQIVIVGHDRNLYAIDTGDGRVEMLDSELTGAIASYGDGWVYSRKPFGSRTVSLKSTSGISLVLDTHGLLAQEIGVLREAGGQTYALDSGDLYLVSAGGLVRVKRGIRSVAGNERQLLLCGLSGEFEVVRDSTTIRRGTCARNESHWPMALAGTDYAVLANSDSLVLSRGGRELTFRTHVSGEYELSMSALGVLALADFDGKTWFVRPDGDRLEIGPLRPSRPVSVATDGHLAAWGYRDGSAVVVNTATDEVWEFRGQVGGVLYIRLDEQQGQLITLGDREFRIWPLTKSSLRQVSTEPCTPFNFLPSLDRKKILFDCATGDVRIWSPVRGDIRTIHRHEGISFELAWVDDLACSGGFDGKVVCSRGDEPSRVVLSGVRISRILAVPDGRRMIVGLSDGKIYEFDGALHLLFEHSAEPRHFALSRDRRFLASSAANGVIVVYDLKDRHVRSRTPAHRGAALEMVWRDNELWSGGADGAVVRWSNEEEVMIPLARTVHGDSVGWLRSWAHGMVAVVRARVVLIDDDSQSGVARFDFDHRIEQIDVSADGRYVAVATSQEVMVVDLATKAVAAVAMRSTGASYAGFAIEGSLLVSDPDRVSIVDLLSLSYSMFNWPN